MKKLSRVLLLSMLVIALILFKNNAFATNENLALNKPAFSSSIDSSSRTPDKAFDGNSTTRWSSAYSSPQWIYVDLQAIYNINEVKLTWEVACGTDYNLQVSSDATTWTTIYSTTTGSGGTNDITGLNGTGRYVRMYGNHRCTGWGYSLWEFEIYGSSTITPTPTVTPTPTDTPPITPTSTPSPTPTPNPNRPDHVVLVIEENHELQQTLGVGYFTKLASQGALMVQSFGVTHPSEPNYLAIFSGSTQSVTNDNCPPSGSPYSTDNLGNQLNTNGLTFVGYAESMPSNPQTCSSGSYVARHVPWAWFSNIPAGEIKDFSQFPTDFTTLPTVSIVIPNQQNNAHDGTLSQASTWLQTNLDNYKDWALTHNSLLIVTTDEDDNGPTNLIYTVFVGQKIQRGIYNETVAHYNILSTLEDLYGFPHLNQAPGITDIFQ